MKRIYLFGNNLGAIDIGLTLVRNTFTNCYMCCIHNMTCVYTGYMYVCSQVWNCVHVQGTGLD